MTADQLPLDPPPPDEYDHGPPPPDWDLGNLPAGTHPNDRYYRPNNDRLPGRQDRDDWADIVAHGHGGTHDLHRPGDTLGAGLLFTEAVSEADYPGDPAAYADQRRRDEWIRTRRLRRLPQDSA